MAQTTGAAVPPPTDADQPSADKRSASATLRAVNSRVWQQPEERAMRKAAFTYWIASDGKCLGYLNQFPDYWTQAPA
jgi:hypothetical protein